MVGDGGTIAQITDIAIDPEYEGKGYGTFIVARIQEFILKHLPEDAFVCLFAEKEIVPFYKSKGFELSQEQWPGMYWPCLLRAQKNREKHTQH